MSDDAKLVVLTSHLKHVSCETYLLSAKSRTRGRADTPRRARAQRLRAARECLLPA